MVYRVQDLSVHSVGMFDWLAIPGYVQDLTLGWIKFHIPCFFPLLENIKIILENTCTFLSLNCQMYSRKSIGPKTDPCGTPDETGNSAELSPSKTTHCVLPIKKDSIHPSVLP